MEGQGIEGKERFKCVPFRIFGESVVVGSTLYVPKLGQVDSEDNGLLLCASHAILLPAEHDSATQGLPSFVP